MQDKHMMPGMPMMEDKDMKGVSKGMNGKKKGKKVSGKSYSKEEMEMAKKIMG